jgi:PIN domain nuclease of toxin-antitoxin system
VILLDASALVAFLAGERSARNVESILRTGEAAITSVNLAECVDVLVRVLGLDADEVDAKLVPLLSTVLAVTPVGEAEGRHAGAVRASYYHREKAPLSLADCVLVASAAILGATIATSDAAIGYVAQREGLDVRALPAAKNR